MRKLRLFSLIFLTFLAITSNLPDSLANIGCEISLVEEEIDQRVKEYGFLNSSDAAFFAYIEVNSDHSNSGSIRNFRVTNIQQIKGTSPKNFEIKGWLYNGSEDEFLLEAIDLIDTSYYQDNWSFLEISTDQRGKILPRCSVFPVLFTGRYQIFYQFEETDRMYTVPLVY